MTRWALLTLGALLVLGALAVVVARMLGRSGSRPSVLVSVASAWLGAWVLWSFAGGLAVGYGVLDRYDGPFFAALALGGGLWQYRVQARDGRERGLVVFVAGQLAWLVIVLARNGILGG